MFTAEPLDVLADAFVCLLACLLAQHLCASQNTSVFSPSVRLSDEEFQREYLKKARGVAHAHNI